MKNTISCQLLIDTPATGSWNMAVDEMLLRQVAAEGGCIWRFYQWSEPTLSLGYFQNLTDRKHHPASRNCPLVRRASGGGAIVHDIELTYSLAIAAEQLAVFGSRRLYDAIHNVLLKSLAELGIEAKLFQPKTSDASIVTKHETTTRDREEAADASKPESIASLDQQTQPVTQPWTSKRAFLCFQRRSPGDVVVADGYKVAGSAQRRLSVPSLSTNTRAAKKTAIKSSKGAFANAQGSLATSASMNGAILQHGSVLLDRSQAAPELPGLMQYASSKISIEGLIESWRTHLERELSFSFILDGLDSRQRGEAKRLVKEKYASNDWNEFRCRR